MRRPGDTNEDRQEESADEQGPETELHLPDSLPQLPTGKPKPTEATGEASKGKSSENITTNPTKVNKVPINVFTIVVGDQFDILDSTNRWCEAEVIRPSLCALFLHFTFRYLFS
jgi:hypothetical protein